MKKISSAVLVVALFGAIFFSFTNARAANHGDGPAASNDPSANLGDLYFFLDPNDNSRAVLSLTMRGFIVAGEAVNTGIFDPTVVFRFLIEETGDAVPDATISVTFSPRVTTASAQVATVKMVRGANTVFEFMAPATNPQVSDTAPPSVVKRDAASGVDFFGGEVDDPFFFDYPAFLRFRASILAGATDPTQLNRARDSFAGYNTMAISLSIPKTLLLNFSSVKIGLSAVSLRPDLRAVTTLGNTSARGRVAMNENVLIGGTVVTGTTTKRLLVRAIGPSLTASGVPGALANPKVTLFDNQAQIVATNLNWQDTQGTEIAATGLAPTDPKEAAIIATLAPGSYTAIVEGEGGGAGVALVEFYDLENASAQPAPRQVDRIGVPLVNLILTPFSRKDEYNTATTQDDAAGRFAPDIVATLTSLGTNNANIAVLKNIAVTNGDFLRLNFNTANSGPGGGNNAGAGFPNGRRVGDDVVDTLLSLITNQSGLTDNVNANDVPFRDVLPYFGNSQQPRAAGVLDDNTRN